jgi:hypothetical protein
MRRQTALPLILFILFLTAWLPRVVGLDVFVTPDERKWLARSANFYEAVSHQRWENTFQREHPGVTVMWAGTLGFLQHFPEYAQQTPGQFTWELENLERWLLENTTHTPIEMLAAGRWWIVLFIALGLALAYLPLRGLIGTLPALIGLLFVLLDPFHIALSRQLHPDGLSATLAFVAFLLLIGWLYDEKRPKRLLILSAIVMALAWLTKSPTILVVPIAGLLGLMVWWQESQNRTFPALLKIALPMVGWGLLTTLLFFAFWPSMWVQPITTLQLMAVETSDYVEQHVNVNYFLGQPTNDPGLIFYPVAYLFRATPFVLIGLVGAVVVAWRNRAPFDTPQRRATAVALAIFAVVFALIITIGAKKFDRYLLPAFLPLDVLAGMGWVGMVGWALGRKAESRKQKAGTTTSPPNPLFGYNVSARSGERGSDRNIEPPFASSPVPLGRGKAVSGSPLSALRSPNPVALAILIVFLHAAPGLMTAPYYLTYYNPLMGGSLTAPTVLFVGWGEGLDEAARWLNQQPNPEQLRVHSWYADGPFSYFFKGRSEILTDFSPLVWLDTDYAVLYVNQWQRQSPSPEALAWFEQQPVAHEVWRDGLELARVYDLRNSPLPDFLDWNDDRRADFGGLIRLAGYKIEKTEVQPGDSFQITLYEKALAPMAVDYNVLVRLVGQDGTEVWRSEGFPWGAPTTDWEVGDSRPDGHTVTVPTDTPDGLYQLVMSFYDPATFAPLTVTQFGAETPTGEGERVVDFIRVGNTSTAQTSLTPAPQLGDVAKIVGVTLPDQAQAGQPLPVTVEWESVTFIPTDYTVFIHLIAPDGTQLAQSDSQPMGNYAPTHLWDAGERFLDTHTLTLPADAPSGIYEVRVGMYTAEERLPLSTGGDFAIVGQIEVP